MTTHSVIARRERSERRGNTSWLERRVRAIRFGYRGPVDRHGLRPRDDMSEFARRERSEGRGNQTRGRPHENKAKGNLAFFPDLLDRMNGLPQIFQRVYDFVSNLSACLEHPSAQRYRSHDRCVHLERSRLCLEGKQHHSEFPAPGIHPRGRIDLHLSHPLIRSC